MPERKGKILYWLHWFPALSETFILNEILELQALGEEIDIIAMNPSPDTMAHPEAMLFDGEVLSPDDSPGGILTAHFYWMTKKPSEYFGLLAKIFGSITHRKTLTVSLVVFIRAIRGAYLLKDRKIRHIHSHFGNAPATGAWIVSHLLGIPFSITVHAVDIFVPDKLLPSKINDVKFIAAISNFNSEYLLEKYPEIDKSKIHLVRCGIKPDEFTFRDSFTASKPPKMLSVGRLVEKKGFIYLLKAVKILKDNHKTIQCTIAGGGKQLNDLEELAKNLGISDQVTFTGSLPSDEIRRLLNDTDLFVLACIVDSRGDRDGIPVVLMESLACGIPSISTEISGIPELIKPFETGLLVPEKDPKALADAILFYLAEIDLRKRLPIAGRKLVESEFNIKKNVKMLRELIGGLE